MDQISFAEAEHSYKRKKARREKFIEQMDTLIPSKNAWKNVFAANIPSREWSLAESAGSYATCSLYAVVLQPERSGD